MWLLLVSCITCMPQSEGKLKIFPRMVLHGGNAADTVSTIKALKNDKIKESNPVLGDNPSNAKLIAVKAGTSFLTDYLLKKLAKKHPKVANGLAIGIGTTLSGIAARNLKLANEHRNK